MTYKLAERFHSIQGEGVHTGTPMHFIRLAGCNVGAFIPPDKLAGSPDLAVLREQHPQLSICTSVFGNQFLCDTAYNKVVEALTVERILAETFEGHICITGGEPFLHDLVPLIAAAQDQGVVSHIETSGTLDVVARLEDVWGDPQPWVTCSPKAGYLASNWQRVSEFKVIVSTDMGTAAEAVCQVSEALGIQVESLGDDVPVFIQPVNGVHSIDPVQLAFAIDMLRSAPGLRLSVQLHKLLGLQ